MAGIFISYRRLNAGTEAQSLANSIAERFPNLETFFDIDSIHPGERFHQKIKTALRRTSVLIVLIGRDWLDATDERGRVRLHNPDDYVRFEIAQSLKSRIPIIPVLLHGAEMPKEELLPRDIRPLAYCNAISLQMSSKLFAAIERYARRSVIDLRTFSVAGALTLISATAVIGLALGIIYTISALLIFNSPDQPGKNVNPGFRLERDLFAWTILPIFIGTLLFAAYIGGIMLEKRFKNITRHLLLMMAYAIILSVAAINFSHNDSLVDYRFQFVLDLILSISSGFILIDFWNTITYGVVTRVAKALLTVVMAVLGLIVPGFFASIYALVQFGVISDARVNAPHLLIPIGLALGVPLAISVLIRR